MTIEPDRHTEKLPRISTTELSTSSETQRSTTTSGRVVAVLLKPLIDLHGEPRNWRTAAPLYIEALADIPPELLAVAVKHAIASNPYFPKPADLRLSIVDELGHHRRRHDEAKRLALPQPPPSPPPSPEDKAYVDRLVAEAKRGIAERTEQLQGDPNHYDEPRDHDKRKKTGGK